MKNQLILFLSTLFVYNCLFAQTNKGSCVTGSQGYKESFLKQTRNVQSKRNNNSKKLAKNYSSYIADDAENYRPTPNQKPINVKVNLIFLTDEDGNGNFDPENEEHQYVIDKIISHTNSKFKSLANTGSAGCYDNLDYIKDTKIQFDFTKIWRKDPKWDWTRSGVDRWDLAGFYSRMNSPLYPPNSYDSDPTTYYYYRYLDTIYKGINVVFPNNGPFLKELVAFNEDYDYNVDNYYTIVFPSGSFYDAERVKYDLRDIYDHFSDPRQAWGAAELPSTSDLSIGSAVIMLDTYYDYQLKKKLVVDYFKKYKGEKYKNLVWNEPGGYNVINWLISSSGYKLLTHELGHSLGLVHSGCLEDIMMNGFKYFKPKDIGTMHKALSVSNIMKFVTNDSYMDLYKPILNGDYNTLNSILRIYSDIEIKNNSFLNANSKLILPPEGKITIKNNSSLFVNGGVLKSIDDAFWNTDNSFPTNNGAAFESDNNSSSDGIRINDNSSIELLPGTTLNSNFYAFADGTNMNNVSQKNIKNKFNGQNFNDIEKDDGAAAGIEKLEPIVIYPNPFVDEFTIEISKFPLNDKELKISDIMGTIVYQGKITKKNTKIDLDLEKGIYYLSIDSESKVLIKN